MQTAITLAYFGLTATFALMIFSFIKMSLTAKKRPLKAFH